MPKAKKLPVEKEEKKEVVKDMKRQQELIEEELGELMHQYDEREKSKAKKVEARGPNAPTARERKMQRARQRAAEIDPYELGAQITGPDVEDVDPSKNPRLQADTDAAKAGRRRVFIWRRREKMGMPQRRPIYDAEGNDTGATTASTE